MSSSATTAATPTTKPPPVAEAVPVHDEPEKAHRLCNEWVASGLSNNKSIQFLLKTLVDSGCTPPDKFIRCTQCKQPQAGGFGVLESSDKLTKPQCEKSYDDIKHQLQTSESTKLLPEIFLCQQYLENEKHVHRTLHHELIHAIDFCRVKDMNPVHNCVHLACTEIRATNLSAECGFWSELPRMSKFAGHGAECVKRRSLLSVRANPICRDEAETYVQAAMPRCSRDYYPYDRHPNERSP